MTAQDREFLSYVYHLRQNDRPGYIALLCMLHRDTGTPVTELKTAPRGDFKRAIKVLRSVQAEHYAPEWIDSVIAHIRREWRHRGEEATE